MVLGLWIAPAVVALMSAIMPGKNVGCRDTASRMRKKSGKNAV